MNKPNKRMRLGDLLVDLGAISMDNLGKALKIQKETRNKLGEVLIEEKFVTEEQIINALQLQLNIDYLDLQEIDIDKNLLEILPEALARKYYIFPVSLNEETNILKIAMADPLNLNAIDDVKIITKKRINYMISKKSDIEDMINQHYGEEDVKKSLDEFKEEFNVDEIDEVDEETLNDIQNSPVVKLVDSIIEQSFNRKASDIHIEPFENFVRVRARVDGELQEMMKFPVRAQSALIARIKIMGSMDISERRKPQDGRIQKSIGTKEIDLRISVLPTAFGEKVVMRILDRSSFMLDKKDLGFTDANLKAFDDIIKNPNGIILVTGPTGSGKSTTLYTVLNELNSIERNIVTVEDPVEYSLDGVNQVQVNPKADLTFATGLRSILRQDPDIVMIGEIRDSETVEIAVKAAITGHLVLSTVHTNDTASTISRLENMGIDNYLIASSVVGVIAQRLVKTICPHCKKDATVNEQDALLTGIEPGTVVKEGAGCKRCGGNGNVGRTAVHEVMIVNRLIRNAINAGKSSDDLKDIAVSQGMLTLKDTCKKLVLEGKISIDEMLKIAYTVDV